MKRKPEENASIEKAGIPLTIPLLKTGTNKTPKEL